MESSASGSSKKARAPGNGTQIPSCLVDGCTSDLGKCRDYHRRHKVCELHSKTSRVTIQGQEKRFCQQCSRFHSLEEFDEGKRSCRKRLDGHNRRRRKSQPDSLSNSERFFSNAQGTKFIPFGSPELFSTSTVTPAWAGSVKAKTDIMLHNDHSQSRSQSQSQSHSHSLLDFSNGNLFQGSFSYNCEGGKQFPFLEGGASTLSGASSVCQPLHTANSSSSNCDSCSQKVFSEYWFNGVVDSSHALSLLSSPQPAIQGIGLNRMVQANSNSLPRAQSLIPSLNYSGLGMDSEPIGSALVTDSSSNADVHGPDTFEIGPEHESPTTGTYPTLSFFWE